MDGVFDHLHTPEELQRTQIKLRSLHHTDLVRVDLAYALAAAEIEGVDSKIIGFLKTYTEMVCKRVEDFEAQIIRDQIAFKTRRPDPAQIVREFNEYLEGERKFKEFVHEATKDFAPVEGHTEEQDIFVSELVAAYNKIQQVIDRNTNQLVRENNFDLSRVEDIGEIRANYDPNNPLSRREGVRLRHGATGPGFFERLLWREEGNDGGDRHVYGEGLEELKNLARDVSNVEIRQTNTAHPTEIETGEAIDAHAEDYEIKRKFIAANTLEEMREAGSRLLAHKRKTMTPEFSLIKLTDGKIDNFTPLDEVDNVHVKSGLLTRVAGIKDCYHTSWRALKQSGFGKLVTPQFLVEDYNIDYKEASWVSTDYDGAFLKMSEHPLPQAVQGMRDMVGDYLWDLSEAARDGLIVGASDGGMPWLQRLTEARDELTIIAKEIRKGIVGRDLILSQSAYTKILDDFESILLKLSNGKSYDELVVTFQKDLEQAFLQNVDIKPEAAFKVLAASKIARSFGFHGSKLEYRQTSERLAEMVDYLLHVNVPGEENFDYRGPKDLEKLPPEEREKRYKKRLEYANKKALEDPDFLYRRAQAARAERGEGTELRNTRNPKDMVHHTDRNFQFFARFPHLADRMVLAEYKSVSNYADAVLIQNAFRDPKTGRKASLDIAPLIEEISMLRIWKDILIDIFTTPITIIHLASRKFRQFFQGAYSDNTKRFGITTRMAIDTIWREAAGFVQNFRTQSASIIRNALQKGGVNIAKEALSKLIKFIPYHGKSLTRPDHGGAYMLTAQMKQHSWPFVEHLDGKVHMDFTAQNHDITAMFSVRDGFKRHIMRLVTEGSQLAAFFRIKREPRRHIAKPELTDMVSEVLQGLQENYERDYASDNSPHGHALAYPLVDNLTESIEGNASPRGASRSATDKPKRNVYARGPDQNHTVPVPQGEMRAITLSENQVKAGSRISFLGVHGEEEKLNKNFRRNPRLKAQLKEFVRNDEARLGFRSGEEAFDEDDNLTLAGLQTLASARVLPPFRTHVDEIGFGPISAPGVPDYAQRQIWAKEQGLPVTDMVQQDLDNRRRDSLAATQLKLKCSGIDPAVYQQHLTDCREDTRIELNYYLLRRMSDMHGSTGEIETARLFNTLGMYTHDQIQVRRYLEGDDEGDRPPTATESIILRTEADSKHCLSMLNAKTVHDFPHNARREERLIDEARRTMRTELGGPN